MADYPFRVNMQSKNGLQRIAFMTASLVTDTDAQISASVMVEKINLMPSASYEDGVVSGSSPQAVHNFGGGRNLYLSCSVTDPNVGAIEFNDTESTSGEGLDFYTFWGTKVCSVLGLPEGIPIYTENFKLSDDSNDPDNYISGDIVAGGVSIKDSLKLSPQARVRSNFNWDEEFGEGLLQWASGSGVQLRLGYDNVNDKYVLTGPVEIDGSPLVSTSEVQSTFFNGQSGDVRLRSGTLALLAGNRTSFDLDENEAQIHLDNNANINARGQLLLRHDESSTWSSSRTTTDYTLILYNRNTSGGGGDAVGEFAGIAFDVGTNDFGSSNNAFASAIISERDNATTDLHDGNLSFATNDAAASGVTKRMTIHHDGFIEVISPNMISGTRGYFDGGESGTFSSDRYLDFNNGTQMTATRGYRMSRPGSVTAVSMQFDVSSTSFGLSGPTTAVYSDVEIQVRKNGSSVFTTELTNISSTSDTGKSATQARGVDTFVAGDIIQLLVNITNNGGYSGQTSSITLNDFNAVAEVVFDT